MSNLVRHICEFTCSPHQSTFINVTATQINPKNNSESARDGPSTVAFNYRSLFAEVYVDGIDVHITEEYMNGTFNSCKSVQFPSSGQLALDLMCGDWGASRCSPMRWYSFMGDAAGNSFVPFQINYRPHNSSAEVDGFKPMDPRVVPCSESVDVSFFAQCSLFTLYCLCFVPQGATPACSCVDCASSCPKPPPPEPVPLKFLIWGLDGYMVVMFFIFLLGSFMFVLGTGCCSSAEAGKSYNVAINPRNIRKEKQLKVSKNSSIAIMKVFFPRFHTPLVSISLVRRKIAIEIDFEVFSFLVE